MWLNENAILLSCAGENNISGSEQKTDKKSHLWKNKKVLQANLKQKASNGQSKIIKYEMEMSEPYCVYPKMSEANTIWAGQR